MADDAQADEEIPGTGRAELLAFGWSETGTDGLLASGRLCAEAVAGGFVVRERASGARLADLPTASAVRRFAHKAEGAEELAAAAPRLAAATLEEELRASREAVQALERAVADLEDQITDLMAKDVLLAGDR